MGESLFDVTVQSSASTWEKLKTSENPKVCKIRQKLECLWNTYQPYADLNFRQEFAKHPHQRFWEMLLCCRLLAWGKNVIPKKYRPQQGPDILVRDAEQQIWIEAVTPTVGQPGKLDTVPGLRVDDDAHAVPDSQLLLRIAQVLEEKRKKFSSYLDNSIVDPNDLCIIAVNGGDQGGFGGFDSVFEPAVYQNRIKTSGDEFWRWDTPCLVQKSNNALVQASVFVTAGYKGIAGAMFSPSMIGNLANSKIEIQYFPNPNSIRRITTNWVPWAKEYVIHEPSSPTVISEMRYGKEIARVLGQFPIKSS